MTIELIFCVSSIAFLLNVLTLWAIGRTSQNAREMNQRLWSRIHYLEMALNYHNLVPMSWEWPSQEFQEEEERRAFKQEGNVVYLQEEDQPCAPHDKARKEKK